MLFNSLQFLVFLPFVVLFYYLLPRRARNVWLLIASYYFYMCWNARYIFLILFSTIVTYLSGRLIDRVRDAGSFRSTSRKRLMKLIVGLCAAINLAILIHFKYSNFAIDTFRRLLALAALDLNVPAVDVLLPVGISFYTFQALGYTVDVYRGTIRAERSFVQYALFVSFFPQLVAGPIERSGHLLKQLSCPHSFDFKKAKEGVLLMLWGFFLKLVIADRLAVFVDAVYGNTPLYGGMYLVVATVFFAMQIYCDFVGYSTIAVGTAKLLGVDLMENFDAPYLSTSVATFWRRWHISLTSWFRDYLYIPLGGSRCGRLRKYANILIVFLVSGLWHGASLSFLVWGGINGLYQIVGDVLKPVRDRLVALLNLHRQTLCHKIAQIVVTFILVDLSWVFFRANSIAQAIEILHSIQSTWNPWIVFDGSLYLCGLDEMNMRLVVVSLLVLFVVDVLKRRGVVVRSVIMRQDSWAQVLIIATSITMLLVFGMYGSAIDEANFIYFQF